MGNLAGYQEVLSIGALSRVNTFCVGDPGTGKSWNARQLLAYSFPDTSTWMTLDPSTPPSRINGEIHIPSLMDGRKVVDVTGTLRDTRFRAFLLDELSRASEPAFDALLEPLTQRIPFIVACSNWRPTSARQEALNDRFGLWYTLDATPMSSKLGKPGDKQDKGLALVSAMLADWNLTGEAALAAQVKTNGRSPFPDPQLVGLVWATAPSQADLQVLSSVMRDINIELEAEGFGLNERKTNDALSILHALTVAKHGGPDYGQVDKAAILALRYLFPEKANKVKEVLRRIVDATSDPAGAMVSALRDELIICLKTLADNVGKPEFTAAITSQSQRLADIKNKLELVNDPRATLLAGQSHGYFVAAVSGNSDVANNIPTVDQLAQHIAATQAPATGETTRLDASAGA